MSGGTVKPDFCGFFLPCSFAFRLSFVRPRRRLSSAPTVDFGRRRAQKLSRSAVAPPQGHTSTFPGHALTASSTAADSVITGRKSALYFSVAWIDVAASTSSPFASGCSSLAGSASISMSRAMVASAYMSAGTVKPLFTFTHSYMGLRESSSGFEARLTFFLPFFLPRGFFVGA